MKEENFMNNSGTPIGENGKKELKITKSDEADKLLDKFFKDSLADKELNIRAIIFDVPEVAIKSKVGEENEGPRPLSVINVLENGKRDFVLEEIAKGAGLNIKLAELRKVRAKTKQLRDKKAAEAEKRNSAGGTEKPDESRDI